jgi:hypothetical protein
VFFLVLKRANKMPSLKIYPMKRKETSGREKEMGERI